MGALERAPLSTLTPQTKDDHESSSVIGSQPPKGRRLARGDCRPSHGHVLPRFSRESAPKLDDEVSNFRLGGGACPRSQRSVDNTVRSHRTIGTQYVSLRLGVARVSKTPLFSVNNRFCPTRRSTVSTNILGEEWGQGPNSCSTSGRPAILLDQNVAGTLTHCQKTDAMQTRGDHPAWLYKGHHEAAEEHDRDLLRKRDEDPCWQCPENNRRACMNRSTGKGLPRHSKQLPQFVYRASPVPPARDETFSNILFNLLSTPTCLCRYLVVVL